MRVRLLVRKYGEYGVRGVVPKLQVVPVFVPGFPLFVTDRRVRGRPTRSGVSSVSAVPPLEIGRRPYSPPHLRTSVWVCLRSFLFVRNDGYATRDRGTRSGDRDEVSCHTGWVGSKGRARYRPTTVPSCRDFHVPSHPTKKRQIFGLVQFTSLSRSVMCKRGVGSVYFLKYGTQFLIVYHTLFPYRP